MHGSPGQRARLAPARALAGLLVPAALATAAAVLGWAAAAPIDAVRAPGPAPVDALLALGAALLCAGLLALTAIGAAVTLAMAVSGRLAGRWAALAQALTPHVVRAAVGMLVGATVVGGQGCLADRAGHSVPPDRVAVVSVATPASPDRTTHLPPGLAPESPAVMSVATPAGPGRITNLPPGWTPDRPAAAKPEAPGRGDAATGRVHAVTTRHSATGVRRLATVVVQRGDTLWALAAHRLGPGATDAEVAGEWPRWHASNRSVIGPDPDLILPGQRLRLPASEHPARNDNARAPIDREESP